MEKATLRVRTTNRGRLIAELYFLESQKTMPVPSDFQVRASMHDMVVEVERVSERIVKIQGGGNLLYLSIGGGSAPGARSSDPSRRQASGQAGTQRHTHQSSRTQQAQTTKNQSKRTTISQNDGPMQTAHVEKVRYAASAPYNFIPLNDKVVDVDQPIPSFDRYHKGRLNGWIDLAIETITPLYIRGTLSEEELKADGVSNETSAFFAPDGALRIPGSSLRGMLRTMVEITSYAKFGFFNDQRLYFRGLADKSNLRKEYQERMSSYDRRSKKATYKMSAGVLRKKGGFHYEILPCEGQFTQISKKDAQKEVRQLGQKYEPLSFYRLQQGYLVVSGDMNNKKKDWLIPFPAPNATPIPVLEQDIQDYKDDTNRAEEVNKRMHLVKRADKCKEVPCFYTIWEDSSGEQRISFGHTAMFRLAYEKSIGEHIPEQLRTQYCRITSERLQALEQDSQFQLLKESQRTTLLQKLRDLGSHDIILKDFEKQLKEMFKTLNISQDYERLLLKYLQRYDIAEAIFGNKTTFASRIAVEDAFLQPDQENVLMGDRVPKILSSPKPTTFQHYLVQSSDNNRQLNHYNSPVTIRGNKLYWHQTGQGWEETDSQNIKDHKTQYTRINPVKPGTEFVGCIRFENLSDVELGALLFALDLPDGCYHKLGMGKPLGLGTVHIRPTLHMTNRLDRYNSVFTEWEQLPETSDISTYLQAFEEHVVKQAGETGKLWNTARLTELKTMLGYEQGKAIEAQGEIRYMEITGKQKNEFKDRPVLPKPSQVK